MKSKVHNSKFPILEKYLPKDLKKLSIREEEHLVTYVIKDIFQEKNAGKNYQKFEIRLFPRSL